MHCWEVTTRVMFLNSYMTPVWYSLFDGNKLGFQLRKASKLWTPPLSWNCLSAEEWRKFRQFRRPVLHLQTVTKGNCRINKHNFWRMWSWVRYLHGCFVCLHFFISQKFREKADLFNFKFHMWIIAIFIVISSEIEPEMCFNLKCGFISSNLVSWKGARIDISTKNSSTIRWTVYCWW